MQRLLRSSEYQLRGLSRGCRDIAQMHRQCAGKDALVALWAGDTPSWGLEGQRNEGERIMERAWDPMRVVCRAYGWHSRWVRANWHLGGWKGCYR